MYTIDTYNLQVYVECVGKCGERAILSTKRLQSRHLHYIQQQSTTATISYYQPKRAVKHV